MKILTNSKFYDIKVVAFQIEQNSKDDVRKSDLYKESKNYYLDTTMSCDKQEAILWIKSYMAEAISYGIESKNANWKYRFMAAFDIFNNLVK